MEISKEDKEQLKLGFKDMLIFGESYYKININEPHLQRIDPQSNEIIELILKTKLNGK